MKELTEKQLMSKLKALGKMDDEKRNDVTCSLIGHSRIQSTFFGYFYCGRCSAQVGDNLAGCYDAKTVVVIDHNCQVCRDNYETTTWRDRLFVRDPFVKPEEAAA